MRKGFTLIEISVVLVIIGFLVAGVVLAQSLIRSSKVQTVITDVATIQTSIKQFRTKYGVLPGDMNNATSYWGTNPNCSSGGSGTGTQTCNGDGDGHIEFNTSPNYEQWTVWQHLANAGLYPGQFTGAGIAGASKSSYCQPGLNCPGGQMNGQQGYSIDYDVGSWEASGTGNAWAIPAAHYLLVGESQPSQTSRHPEFNLFTAPEAAMLDAKVDDGLPGMGNWLTFAANGTSRSWAGNCVIDSTTGVAPVDGTAAREAVSVYNVKYSSSNPACAFIINLGF